MLLIWFNAPADTSHKVETALCAVQIADLLERSNAVHDFPERTGHVLDALESLAALAELPLDGHAITVTSRNKPAPLILTWYGDVDGQECVVLVGAAPGRTEEEGAESFFVPLLLTEGEWTPVLSSAGKMGGVVMSVDQDMPPAADILSFLYDAAEKQRGRRRPATPEATSEQDEQT